MERKEFKIILFGTKPESYQILWDARFLNYDDVFSNDIKCISFIKFDITPGIMDFHLIYHFHKVPVYNQFISSNGVVSRHYHILFGEIVADEMIISKLFRNNYLDIQSIQYPSSQLVPHGGNVHRRHYPS